MLKKFGFLVALIAPLTGCGNENKTVSAESSKPTPPLVGCYSDAEKLPMGGNELITVSANNGEYKITYGKDGEFRDGKASVFKLYEGAQNIENGAKENLSEPSTAEEKEGIKQLASAVERALFEQVKDSGYMFFEVKAEIAKEKGAHYFLQSNMIYPLKKIDCPK
ncbi:hypothetical protein [Undibacterium sp. Ji22W]|uniref:hypothetical protein n=1 Tax=Undibacterium sp. Ji22W TaxID=3413038 RepID=UPI003BF1CA7B